MKTGKRVFWIVILLVSVFLGMAGYNFWQAGQKTVKAVKQEPAVPVQVYRVDWGTLDWMVHGTGDLLPQQVVELYPQVPGEIIEKILVDRGDQVHTGQPLVLLDMTRIRARIARARAQVEVSKSNLAVLEKDYQRMNRLVQSRSASRQKLDHLQAELDVARARLKASQAALQELDIVAREHVILSPINGRVLERFVDPGNISSTAQPILRLGNLKTLKLQTSLAEDLLGHVRPGTPVSFNVDAYPDRVFKGQVHLISPALEPRTRTLSLEVRIANDGYLLRPGMYARLTVLLGSKRALVLSRDGLNQTPGTGSFYVFVVQKGRAVLQNVTLGLQVDNLVEVKTGLQPGDLVVVRGQDRLKDGQLVRIMGGE